MTNKTRPDALVLPTVPVHSIKKFRWQGTKGVTESSNLLGSFMTELFRTEPDQGDWGFWVQGNKHSRVLFILSNVITGPEGDCQAWDFQSRDGVYSIRVFWD